MTGLQEIKDRTPYPSPNTANKCETCTRCRPVSAAHMCERFSWLIRNPVRDGCNRHQA